MTLQQTSVIFFIGFLIFVGLVAFISGKLGNRTTSGSADVDYYLGGRSTPTVVLAFSYVTSSISAVCFMGDPGIMSTVGWPYYWVVIAVIPGLIIPAVLLMPKMRMQAEKLGSLTIPEYLGDRYKSETLRLIIAGVISVFYIFPLVAQFKGAAVLLESFTGISFKAGLAIISVVIVFYVIVGGLKSVAWTDFVQGLPMLVISVVLVVLSLKAVGGFNGLEMKLAEINPDMLNIVQAEASDAQMSLSGVIGNFMFWCVIFISQPYLCSRFLAIPDIKRKTIGTFLITALILSSVYNSFYLCGLTGRVLFPDVPADYLTVTMAKEMLPTWAAALMMIGIFAAMMSTATSVLLVVGQAIGRDFYSKTINKNATPEQEVLVTRIAVIVIAAICFGFNFVNPPEFLSVVLYLGLSGIGSCIGVPLFSAIISQKSTKEGAIVSAIAGPVSYLVFNYGMAINYWFSCLLAILVSAIFMIGISTYINHSQKTQNGYKACVDPVK